MRGQLRKGVSSGEQDEVQHPRFAEDIDADADAADESSGSKTWPLAVLKTPSAGSRPLPRPHTADEVEVDDVDASAPVPVAPDTLPPVHRPRAVERPPVAERPPSWGGVQPLERARTSLEGGGSLGEPQALPAATPTAAHALQSAPTPPRAKSGATNSARAWPHFVSRLELEVDLRAIHERLDTLLHRVEWSEMRDVAMHNQIQELRARCETDLATRSELAEAEDRLDAELVGRRREVHEGLEELREKAEAVKDFGQVRQEHRTHLATVDNTLAKVFENVAQLRSDLADAAKHNSETFGTRAFLQSETSRFHDEILQNRELLAVAKAERQEAKVKLEVAADERKAFHAHLEGMARRIDEEASLIQGLRGDLTDFQRSSGQNFVCKTQMAQTDELLAATVTMVDARQVDCEQLRRDLEHEKEAHRTTRATLDDALNSIFNSLERVSEMDAEKKHFQERVDENAEKLVRLSAREEEHWSSTQASLRSSAEAHDEQLRELKASLDRLQGVCDQHVLQFDSLAEQLKRECTGLSLQHLDRAVGLTQTVQKLERNHEELSATLRQHAQAGGDLTPAAQPA